VPRGSRKDQESTQESLRAFIRELARAFKTIIKEPIMAETIGTIIAASCSLGVKYAERLLKDVPASDFARLARPGGECVASNHGAFVLGHLSLYAPRIVEQLGGDASAIRPPAEFEPLFAKDAVCRDDPDGTIYPPCEVITTAFFRSYQAAIETLRAARDESLLEPNPTTGTLRDLFPTKGAMHAFYVGGHLMLHLGQMSAWRRMMGLGPA
jgi:hypothetical protein